MALRETAALLSWTFGGIPLVWEALLIAAIAAIAVIELIVVVRNHRRGIRA
jgi:ABC-type phosphate transport system auxiliary subunit